MNATAAFDSKQKVDRLRVRAEGAQRALTMHLVKTPTLLPQLLLVTLFT